MNKSKGAKTAELGSNTRVSRPASAVCVFCGSSQGCKPAYKAAAHTLGTELARQGIGLVYGGSSLGLMGTVARAALAEGGHVTGIVPLFLSEREQQLPDIAELTVVDSMHERKMAMFERSQAFVALPGGVGTLEELVEQLSWAQLGRHEKPIVLANIEGFWDPLLHLLDDMRRQTFIRQGHEVNIAIVNSANDIVPAIVQSISSLERNAAAVLDAKNKF